MSGWIQHVKKVQEKNGISYKEAMKIASKTYMKGGMKQGTADSGGVDKKTLPFKVPQFMPGLFSDPPKKKIDPDPPGYQVAEELGVGRQQAGPYDFGQQPRIQLAVLDPYVQQQSPEIKFLIDNLNLLPKEERSHAKDLAEAYDSDRINLTAKQKHRLTYYIDYLSSLRSEPSKPLKFHGSGFKLGRDQKLTDSVKPSNWIQHVKSVQAKHGISYKDAMKVASKSYRR
jgi:hypothetical protein